MADSVYQLSLLLSLKDAASGGLEQFQARLLATGRAAEGHVKSLQRMRSEMNRGIAMTGIGTAGLALMAKGVQVAGDFQASMTELRSSFAQVGADGKINLTSLGSDMQRAEVVAMKLGNALPGTTEDFVQMMQVLKQNGLGIETILNGAADAVGNLAVATNSVPREIAADFAKFGNLFKLRAEDFAPAADVFARIYSSTGQTSSELVEAAKYFQGRAGQSLGIKGLADAEKYTRLFGYLGKNGLTGTMAGTGLSQFFDQYQQHKDKLDDLQNETGIKLKFFDDKGKFIGLEKVVEQMGQFNKLSDEARSTWMSNIFGELGKGVGNLLTDTNGWKQFNAEQDKTISLAQKNAEIAKNFNNQLESLTGSLKNLVVTGFTPLLPAITNGAEGANKMVSAFIDFSRANPVLTSTIAKLALLGTTAVTVVGSIKTLYNAFGLMRFAANFSSEERVTGFLRKLRENADGAAPAVAKASKTVTSAVVASADALSQSATKTESASKGVTKELTAKQKALRALRGPISEATTGFKAYAAADKALGESVSTTTRKLGEAEQKVSRFRTAYQGLASSGLVRLGVQVAGVMAAEFAVSELVKHISDVETRAENVRQKAAEIAQTYDDLLSKGEAFKAPGDKANREVEVKSAKDFFEAIDEGGLLRRGLRPQDQTFWDAIDKPYSKGVRFGDQDPFAFDPKIAGKRWQDQKLGQIGRDPNMLAAVLRELPTYASEQGLNQDEIKALTAAIEELVGAEKMNAAKEILNKEKVVQGAIPGPTNQQERFWQSVGKPMGVPNIKSLSSPWLIPSFNLNQYTDGRMGNQPIFQPQKPSPIAKTPITADAKIKLFDLLGNSPKAPAPTQTPSSTAPVDLKKVLDVPKAAEVLSSLNQPVATNVTNFQNMTGPAAASVTNFTDMSQPAAQTAQSFSTMVDPANRMPGSFGRINTSVGNVAGSLDTLSQSIASWRPPASSGAVGADGKPVPVLNPGGAATGAFVGHSGLAFIHAKEEVVPAGLRRHRDTLGENLRASISNVRNQDLGDRISQAISLMNTTNRSESAFEAINQIINSAGNISPTLNLTTIAGNDRYSPQPEAKGLFPQSTATQTSSSVSSGSFESLESLKTIERDGEFRNNAAPFTPLQVSINGGDITINAKGSVTPEIVKEIETLQARQLERIQQIVDQKLNPQEIEHIVRRRMESGRQRA